jgi:hypothetical protein
MLKPKTLFLVSLMVCINFAFTSAAWAKKGNDRGKPHQSSSSQSPREVESLISFNEAQQELLEELFDDLYHDQLDEDLWVEIYAQVGHFPPGMINRIQQGKPLPPGIAKKVRLPLTINDWLGLSRDRYVIVVIDSKVILVDEITGVVQDIIEDVLDEIL